MLSSVGDTSIKKLNTINRRMFIISAAKVVIFTGIIARLFSLQINENKKYLTLSDKNRIREWKLPPTRGNIVDYFGNVILVNFWATWCKPCVEELPSFEKIYDKYKGQNVEVILVSLDFPKKVDDVLVPFIEKNKLKSNVILLDDPKQNRWIPKVDKDWSGAIPATIIINENNRSFYEKSFTFIELEDQLKGFITN